MQQLVPMDTLARICAMLPPIRDSSLDPLIWKHTVFEKFSCASARNLITRQLTFSKDPFWATLWKLEIPENIKAFIWRLMHDALWTNSERHRRGIAQSSACHIYSYTETALHGLRDCYRCREVWKGLSPPISFFDTYSHQDSIIFNLISSSVSCHWQVTFTLACWRMWTSRNATIFQHQAIRGAHLCARITASVVETQKFFAYHSSQMRTRQRHSEYLLIPSRQQASGSPLPLPEFFLQVDGAANKSNLRAACGGVLKDSTECWIAGFQGCLGTCSSITVELWAILHGLHLVQLKHLQNVVIESDCKNAIKAIHGSVADLPNQGLVKKIQQVLGETSTTIQHCSCSLLHEADELAKTGLAKDLLGIQYMDGDPFAQPVLSAPMQHCAPAISASIPNVLITVRSDVPAFHCHIGSRNVLQFDVPPVGPDLHVDSGHHHSRPP